MHLISKCMLCSAGIVGGITKTLGAIGSGFGNFGFGGGTTSEETSDTASRGQKAAKPTEQDSGSSWAAF